MMKLMMAAWRVFKWCVVLAAIGLLGIVAFVALVWLDHFRETVLPEPTGPHAVGRTTSVWSDSEWVDSMAPVAGAKREVVAWIWYPASPGDGSRPRADYLPRAWLTAVLAQRGAVISGLLTRDLSRVRTYSVADAEMAQEERSYPVILMRAGLAALTTGYTSLAEDLASHGYVVVGIDAPYRSSTVVFPDGRVIARAPENNLDQFSGAEQRERATRLVKAWSSDMSFALDQLERLNRADPSGRFFGRLDTKRVGVFGHSLGGATALQLCHDEARCAVGIDVDGAPLGEVIRDGITPPFLFLLSDHRSEPDYETSEVLGNIRAIYERLSADRRGWVMIRGAGHFMFSDDGAMLKSPVIMSLLRTVGIIPIDGRRQLAVTSEAVRRFLDIHLKGTAEQDPHWLTQIPEVEVMK